MPRWRAAVKSRFCEHGEALLLGRGEEEAQPTTARRQTTTALCALIALVGVGALLIVIFSLFSGLPQSMRFAYLGLTAAIAALGAGGALGLLFGLPTTRTSAAGWYSESTSLEQIADWLVKIIVGVTLTQFNELTERFDRASTALTRGMMCPEARACGEETGAVLLGAFFVLGFLVSYLWMRRYFMVELVHGRGEALRREHEVMSLAEHAGTIQQRVVGPDRSDFNALAMRVVANAPASDGPAVEPGPDEDDPWKGAFGASAKADGAQLTARVAALRHKPGLFDIELLLEVEDEAKRSAYDGKRAHFYLHPTFSRPVQAVRIRHGRARLPLVAYGAFTVGVQLPDQARLELDLSELADAPQAFRNA